MVLISLMLNSDSFLIEKDTSYKFNFRSLKKSSSMAPNENFNKKIISFCLEVLLYFTLSISNSAFSVYVRKINLNCIDYYKL